MIKRIYSKIVSKAIKMSTKPIIMWIDGTSYHIKSPNKSQDNSQEELSKTSDIQHQESFKISLQDDGKYSTSFCLPSYYYKKIQTYPQFSVDSFQQNTKTTIYIPEHWKTGNITITGSNERIVAEAREKLHTIIGDIRKKSRPSQFISIPTLSDEIKNNVMKFKEDILGFDEKIKGVEESIFIQPEKLHITVLVLSLFDNTEIEEATKVLNNLKEDVLNKLLHDKKFKIRVKGLECMDKNLNKCHVLYAKAAFEDDDSLQNVVNNIFDYFHAKGLVKEIRGDQVKIHITLMNTSKRTPNNRKTWARNKIPFDATKIISAYKDFDFGICDFNSIHLSLMGSAGEDGFYIPLSTIEI